MRERRIRGGKGWRWGIEAVSIEGKVVFRNISVLNDLELNNREICQQTDLGLGINRFS